MPKELSRSVKKPRHASQRPLHSLWSLDPERKIPFWRLKSETFLEELFTEAWARLAEPERDGKACRNFQRQEVVSNPGTERGDERKRSSQEPWGGGDTQKRRGPGGPWPLQHQDAETKKTWGALTPWPLSLDIFQSPAGASHWPNSTKSQWQGNVGHIACMLQPSGTQRGQAMWRVDFEVGAKLEEAASYIQDDKGQDRATCSCVKQTVDGRQVCQVVCLCRIETGCPRNLVRSFPFYVTHLSLVWAVDGEQQ